MVAWTVWKYVKEGGRCPLDEWLADNAVTNKDRARLDARINIIEGIDGELPPEHLKLYRGTRLYELKVRAEGKQLRPLCWKLEDRKIVVLCGAFERDGKIPRGTLEAADNLLSDLLNGKGNVRHYFKT